MQNNLPSEVSLTSKEKDVIQNILIKHPKRTDLEASVLDYRKQLGSDTSNELVETLKSKLVHKFSVRGWGGKKSDYKCINEASGSYYTSLVNDKKDIKQLYGHTDRFTEGVSSIVAYSEGEGDDNNLKLVALVYQTNEGSYVVDANDKVILSSKRHFRGRTLTGKNGNTIGRIWKTGDKSYLLDQNNNILRSGGDKHIECYEDPIDEKIITITYRDDDGLTHVFYRDDAEKFEEVFSTQSYVVKFYTDNDMKLIFQFHNSSLTPYFVDFRIITQLLGTGKKTSKTLIETLQ